MGRGANGREWKAPSPGCGLSMRLWIRPSVISFTFPFTYSQDSDGVFLSIFHLTFFCYIYPLYVTCDCLACTYVCAPCACVVPAEVMGDIRCPRTRVTERCGPLRRCWEQSLDSLQEQVLLATDASLQPSVFYFVYGFIMSISRHDSSVSTPTPKCCICCPLEVNELAAKTHLRGRHMFVPHWSRQGSPEPPSIILPLVEKQVLTRDGRQLATRRGLIGNDSCAQTQSLPQCRGLL